MKNKITFKKNNSDALIAKYELYRAGTKDGLFAVENKIAETADFGGSDTVVFIDQTAVYGVEYYYGLMAVSKQGYGIPSAPVYSCRYKNNGGIKPDFLVGNLEAGIVGYNLIEPYATHLQMDSVFEKSYNEVGPFAGVAKNANATPSDIVLTGYYRGIPSHWLMCGCRALSQINQYGQTDAFLNAFNTLYNNAKQKTPTIFVNGFEYYYESVSIGEWNEILEGLEYRFLATALVKKQPLAHSAYTSAYSTTRMVILKNESGQHQFYRQVSADTPLVPVTTSMAIGSGALGPGFAAPIALRPVQQ